MWKGPRHSENPSGLDNDFSPERTSSDTHVRHGGEGSDSTTKGNIKNIGGGGLHLNKLDNLDEMNKYLKRHKSRSR